MSETKQQKPFYNDWALIILACLTLGLAPFFPEPHIFGKVKWLLGGGVGMKAMDYFDFLMHGLPFFMLIRLLILLVVRKVKQAG